MKINAAIFFYFESMDHTSAQSTPVPIGFRMKRVYKSWYSHQLRIQEDYFPNRAFFQITLFTRLKEGTHLRKYRKVYTAV